MTLASLGSLFSRLAFFQMREELSALRREKSLAEPKPMNEGNKNQ
jgi:hypothetical protein